MGKGIVRKTMKGGKKDIAVHQGDQVDIIRMVDNDKGKWLIRILNTDKGQLWIFFLNSFFGYSNESGFVFHILLKIFHKFYIA